jgi:hypothetical protein
MSITDNTFPIRHHGQGVLAHPITQMYSLFAAQTHTYSRSLIILDSRRRLDLIFFRWVYLLPVTTSLGPRFKTIHFYCGQDSWLDGYANIGVRRSLMRKSRALKCWFLLPSPSHVPIVLTHCPSRRILLGLSDMSSGKQNLLSRVLNKFQNASRPQEAIAPAAHAPSGSQAHERSTAFEEEMREATRVPSQVPAIWVQDHSKHHYGDTTCAFPKSSIDKTS